MKHLVWLCILICGTLSAQLEGIPVKGKLKKSYYLTERFEPSKKKAATFIVQINDLDDKNFELIRKRLSDDKVVLSAVLEKQNLDDICGTVTKHGKGKAKEVIAYQLGLKHGPYSSTNEEGKIELQGEYENNNRIGEWKVLNEDGYYDLGGFTNGKMNGEWKLGNGTDQPRLQFYSNGVPIGDKNVDYNAKSIVSKKRPDLGKYKSDYGIINMKGEVVVPLEYRSLYAYGKAVKAEKNKLKGYIDWNGKVIIPLIYQQISDYRNVFMFAKKDGKYGAINDQNEVIIPFVFDKLPWSYNGHDLIKAKRYGKWGYIDKTGKTKIPFKYEMACDFYRYEAFVKEKGRWYKIDKTGLKKRPYNNRWDECEEDMETIVEAIDESEFGRKKYTETGETFVLYKSPTGWRNAPYGVKDGAGNWVVPRQYKRVTSYRNGMIKVTNDDGKVGFYNDRGQLVIEPQYDRATDFGFTGWDD